MMSMCRSGAPATSQSLEAAGAKDSKVQTVAQLMPLKTVVQHCIAHVNYCYDCSNYQWHEIERMAQQRPKQMTMRYEHNEFMNHTGMKRSVLPELAEQMTYTPLKSVCK